MTSHRPTRPRFPFFKDETGQGFLSRHITLKASLRMLIISFMIGAVVIALVAWWAVIKIGQIDQLISDRHDAAANDRSNQASIIAQNKADAFAAVADLACSVANLYPPGTSVYLDGLRAKYRCPPYVAPSTPAAITPPAGRITVVPSGQNPGQNSTRNSPAPQAVGTPLPAPRTSTATPTPSTVPTPTPSVTPIIDLPDLGCRLIGLLC